MEGSFEFNAGCIGGVDELLEKLALFEEYL